MLQYEKIFQIKVTSEMYLPTDISTRYERYRCILFLGSCLVVMVSGCSIWKNVKWHFERSSETNVTESLYNHVVGSYHSLLLPRLFVDGCVFLAEARNVSISQVIWESFYADLSTSVCVLYLSNAGATYVSCS